MRPGLFSNFLSSPIEYDKATEFWCDLVRIAMKDRFVREGWRKWFNTDFADGTPQRDGNPIASFVSVARHRGISIIQDPDVSSKPITSSIRVFAKGEKEEAPFLEIDAYLNDDTAAIARKLIKEWLESEDTSSAMDEKIQDLCDRLSRSFRS
jgi:hypothetical protein